MFNNNNIDYSILHVDYRVRLFCLFGGPYISCPADLQVQIMADQRFCLRWNNHQPNLVNVMTGLLNSEMFVDATIAAEGRKIQVHKVVLSACSSYFQVRPKTQIHILTISNGRSL